MTPTCPICIALDGLDRMRKLKAGQDLPGYALHGQPFGFPELAGLAEGVLDHVAQAGPQCTRHAAAPNVCRDCRVLPPMRGISTCRACTLDAMSGFVPDKHEGGGERGE